MPGLVLLMLMCLFKTQRGNRSGGLGLKAGGHHARGGISGVSLLGGRCMWRVVEVLTSSRV